MTRDPHEGVGPSRALRTGVGRAPVGAPYDHVLEVAADAVAGAVGGALHGLYVYGSVATGLARPPRSDLDLHLVVRRPMTGEVREVAGALTDRFADVVREVGVSAALLDEVLAPSLEGHAERCFVRHYCRHVLGQDLRPRLPDCTVTESLARGFNGNVAAVLDGVVAGLHDGPGQGTERGLVSKGSRKLLMAAATLLSARRGEWTTDRQRGARMLALHAPDLAARVGAVLDWCSLDTSDGAAPTVDQAVSTFVVIRDRLAREYAVEVSDAATGRATARTSSVALLSAELAHWARSQPDVVAIGLAGSHANGTATATSDIDLILLVEDVGARLGDAGWPDAFGVATSVADEDWGAVQSRRVHYRSGLEVEFGLATTDWARLPLDDGTARVMRNGLRVIHDPPGLLDGALRAARVPPEQPPPR